MINVFTLLLSMARRILIKNIQVIEDLLEKLESWRRWKYEVVIDEDWELNGVGWPILFKVSESGFFFTFSLPYQPLNSIYFDDGPLWCSYPAIVHSKSIIFSKSASILFVLASYKYSSNHRYSFWGLPVLEIGFNLFSLGRGKLLGA